MDVCKWTFAGHTVRLVDERWNKTIQQRSPWNEGRGRGRLKLKWVYDLKRQAELGWLRIERYREKGTIGRPNSKSGYLWARRRKRILI